MGIEMNWKNRRNSHRKSFFFPATIYRQDRTILCGCKILDISETGARLKIDREFAEVTLDIPQLFLLSMTSRDDRLHDSLSVARRCEMVWQKEREIGVKFLDRAAPRHGEK